MQEDTLKLAIEKYDYIRNRCDELGKDIFETKLLFESAICMRGPEAAEFFYSDSRLTRKDAAPRRLRKTLFGEGGVQGLEGAEHYERKELFLELLFGRTADSLVDHVEREWNRAIEHWQTPGHGRLGGRVTEAPRSGRVALGRCARQLDRLGASHQGPVRPDRRLRKYRPTALAGAPRAQAARHAVCRCYPSCKGAVRSRRRCASCTSGALPE